MRSVKGMEKWAGMKGRLFDTTPKKQDRIRGT